MIIQIKKGHPQLGPSDGCAMMFNEEGKSYATGPAWKIKNGKWNSLAEIQSTEPIVETLKEDRTSLRFRIIYEFEDKEITVSETITLRPGYVEVKDEILGDIDSMMITWPVLVFDGKNDTKVNFSKNSVNLELNEKKMNFSIIKPANIKMLMSCNKINHRNGIVQIAYTKIEGNEVTYRINLPKNELE